MSPCQCHRVSVTACPHGPACDVETPTPGTGAAVIEDDAESVRDLLATGRSLICVNLLRAIESLISDLGNNRVTTKAALKA